MTSKPVCAAIKKIRSVRENFQYEGTLFMKSANNQLSQYSSNNWTSVVEDMKNLSRQLKYKTGKLDLETI